MDRRALALALVLFAAASSGCKKRPVNLTYQIEAHDNALVGATVVVGGKRATLEVPYSGTARAMITLPTNGPSVIENITAELPTPCGLKTITLKARQTRSDEERAKKSYSMFYVDVSPQDTIPASVPVWVDQGPSRAGAVQVGSAALKQGKNRVFDYECDASIEVKGPAGDVLGTLPHVGKSHKAVFVTATDQCYSYEGVVYSTNPLGGGGTRTVFSGRHVYGLPSEDIEYFLSRAPSSRSGSYSYVHELVVVPCAR